MRIYSKVIAVTALCFMLYGCNGNPSKPDAPTALNIPELTGIAATLPQFAKEENEVQIADGFNDVDPSWVVGALVNTKTGKVRALDSYLKTDAKLKTTPQAEIAFKNFIENSAAANAAWLEFVKAEVNDKTRAEVTVTKTAKVTADSTSIDKQKLLTELTKIPASTRADYGVIIGYVDFVLAATYFRDSGANGSVSGYGAKIGGNWYSKYENSASHHRIVAIWSPLPFVLDVIDSQKSKDLSKATLEAISSGKLNIQRLQSIIRIQ